MISFTQLDAQQTPGSLAATSAAVLAIRSRVALDPETSCLRQCAGRQWIAERVHQGTQGKYPSDTELL